MPGDFQDDSREIEMRELFGLYKDTTEGRGGVDACMGIDNLVIPFELKTTAGDSVTTVRDFGPDHIEKWRDKHWLIGFYDGENVLHYKYASPEYMESWIQEKSDYIAPDFKIIDFVSNNLNLHDMYEIIGEKNEYTIEDAKALHKKQYTVSKYKELLDLQIGYSPQKMLEIFKERSNLVSNNLNLDDLYKILGEKSQYTIEDARALQKKQYTVGHYTEQKNSETGYTPERMLEIFKDRSDLISSDLDLDVMYKILGEKNEYTIEDAKELQKKHYTMQRYKELQDLVFVGYSPERMLQIFKDRVKYLISRGSTLNNPHIPNSYFDDCPEITENHVEQLKSMVRASF